MQINGDGRKVETNCPHCSVRHKVLVETCELSWFILTELKFGGVVCSPCFDDGARAHHLAQMAQ
ncbi:hypothetical protein [Desulfonatronospira sp. MSAO_Bac3]|uniref:hypothetical protein n=1 Tax=Desulfonatronospira sp. MSAO_Bac3 TaxID=2293857 RepID=UPI00257DC1A1|nr:hypothetical protein [Desulfonatronospira sp. MSAO_Bac3]